MEVPVSTPRVTHLITSLDADGAQRMLLRLLGQLRSSGTDTQVISLRPLTGVAEQLRREGVTVRSLNMSRLRIAAAPLRLVRWLRACRPDVLVSWLYHANLLAAAAAPWAGRIPTIWNVRHTRIHRADRLLTRCVARLCASLANRPVKTVFCSQQSRQWHVARGYPSHDCLVVPNGFDVYQYRPDAQARLAVRQELGVSPETRLVGHVGRFHPDKDHRSVIAAARHVAAAMPDVHFVFCGRGVDRLNARLAYWTDASGIGSRCHLLGARSDMPRLIGALDVLVNSSATEAFSNVLGEAMACGVPCVATDVGDSAWIVGDTGRVVPSGRARQLADACVELLTLPAEQRHALAAGARQRVQSHFDLAHTAQRHFELWSQAAQRPIAPHRIPTAA